MTDKEQRAHDLAMLMLSHGVNHLGADGQGFSFNTWQGAVTGDENECDFIAEHYQRAYNAFLKVLDDRGF